MSKIISHKELKVFQLSFEAAMQIFEISKSFPSEEKYSLTDQIRRSSRSVSGTIAEAWRKRRYEKSFVAKLSDSEGEAAETQVWLDYSFACKYINEEIYNELYAKYDHILAMLVKMIFNPKQWTLSKK
tara:strand:+ start:36881 stop:37264 length:384 start_codon:yes stop_codon:yes gene_type:complete